MTASVPDDYRLRHPIAITEANRSIVIFVGNARGGLSASQRADVAGLAQTWVREGTGAIVVDVPVDTPNAQAADSTFRQIRAQLAAGGVAPRAIVLPPLPSQRPPNARHDQAELSEGLRPWPAPAACGREDLGPSILDPRYSENKQYSNFRLR